MESAEFVKFRIQVRVVKMIMIIVIIMMIINNIYIYREREM